MVDRVANALSTVTDTVLLISNSPDAPRWLSRVTTVGDRRAERGSLVGIHSALTHARAPVLVVAWDMPFVSPPLLRLISERGKSAAFAAVPHGLAGPEPFCAVYTLACVAYIEAALDEGDLRLSALLQRLPHVDEIDLDEVSEAGDPDRLFLNVNDLADLAVAERLAAGV